MNIRTGDRIRFDSKREGKGTGVVASIVNFILHVDTDDGRHILLSDVTSYVEVLEVYDVQIKSSTDISTSCIQLENVTREDLKAFEELSKKYELYMTHSKKMLESW